MESGRQSRGALNQWRAAAAAFLRTLSINWFLQNASGPTAWP